MKLKWFNLDDEGNYELKNLASVEENAKKETKKVEVKKEAKEEAPKRSRKKVAK